MAEPTLTPVSPKRSALAPLPGVTATEAGDTFLNTGKELLVVEHIDDQGADVTLTIVTTKTIDTGELAVGDKAITITKGLRYLIGPFPTGIYNDADGLVSITYSEHEDIEVAVVKPA